MLICRYSYKSTINTENHALANIPLFPIKALLEHPYVKLYEGVDDEISEVFEIHQIIPDVQFSRRIIIKELEIPPYRDLGIAVKDKSTLSASTQKFLSYVQSWISEEYDLL